MVYAAPLKTYGRLKTNENLSSRLFVEQTQVIEEPPPPPPPPPGDMTNTFYDFSQDYTIEEL